MAPSAGVDRRGGRVSRDVPRRPIVRRYDAARRGAAIGLRPICGACRAACTLRERDSMKRKHLSLAIGCVLLSPAAWAQQAERSEEHTSELQSLMRISYAVFCLKKKKTQTSNVIRKNPTKEQ